MAVACALTNMFSAKFRASAGFSAAGLYVLRDSRRIDSRARLYMYM